MPRLRPRLAAFAAAAAALLPAGAAPAAPSGAGDPPVVRGVDFRDEVTPVSARFVERALQDAADDGAALVVIRMDTPGGLDTSMRDIIRAMTASPVPVAVWVGPSGARAASAGAYITAASDVAAMAPGTNIGSATPVSGGGGGDLEDKIVNDAAAYIASLAAEHGRDQAAYRGMVTRQANLTAEQARDRRVVEVLAATPEELLAALDGRRVDGATLDLAGATVRFEGMPWHLRLLDLVADPNLVFLFFSLGLLALGWEVFHPGAMVPGVVGAVLLVLALFGLSILPFRWAGLAFIALAAVLFVAETQVAGVGVLAAGGAVSLVIGGLILFDDPAFETSTPLAVVTGAAVGGALLLIVRLARRIRAIAPATGPAVLVGAVGEVRAPVDGAPGQVFVNGELWAARTPDGSAVPRGERVRVVNMEELTLIVEPTRENSA